MAKPKDDKREIKADRSPKEAARVRDDILKRMLHTKPKQQKDVVAERRKKRAHGPERGQDD